MTFNTPETTNFIFDYLKHRLNTNGKIDRQEALFKSQRGNFLTPDTIEHHFRDLNKRLGNQKDKNGKFGKFRIHNLRKLFKTTCRRALKEVSIDTKITYDGDIVNLFTGNTTKDNPLAVVYEAVPKDSHDSYVRKTYEKLIDYLSIQPTEVKDFKTKDRLEWENNLNQIKANQQKKLDEKDNQINTLENKLKQAEKRIDEIKDEVNHKKYILPDAQIGAIIMEHVGIKTSEDYLISLLATKEAFKDKTNFENTPEYLDRLIRKAKVIIDLSDKDLMELQVETGFKLAKGEPNYTLIQIMDDVIEIINNNNIPEMKNIHRFDLQNAIEFQIINSDYDIESITDTDKNAIARDVILSYI